MKILIILFLPISLFSQHVLNTNGNYGLVVIGDSLCVNEYIDHIEIVTNANETGNQAYECDTTTIIDSLDQYKASLPSLPATGIWIERNDLYVYEDELCRVIQSHWRTSHDPHDVPALFLFRELGCSEWVQPTGGHDSYNLGDCVTFNGNEYESLINANVWSPTVYPAGWQLK